MGHITTRDFGFHWASDKRSTPKAKQEAGEHWLRRIFAVVAARLEADTPPLATAMTYSRAYRATPVPS